MHFYSAPLKPFAWPAEAPVAAAGSIGKGIYAGSLTIVHVSWSGKDDR